MGRDDILKGHIRDPRLWAGDCRTQAQFAVEPEARAAFIQLAEEFESISSEIDGLVGSYEAMVRRKTIYGNA
jgi:hypothetical protein